MPDGEWKSLAPPEEEVRINQECQSEQFGLENGFRWLALGAVQEFLVPRHLDSFQFALIGLFRITLELGQFDHVAMQIGETYVQRIEFGMLLGKKNSNVFGIIPRQFFRHRLCTSMCF